MIFTKLTTDHIPLLQRYFRTQTWRTCDYSAGAVLMWADYLDTRFCETNGCLVFRARHLDGRRYFSYPVGDGDRDAALDTVERYARANGIVFDLSDVPSEEIPYLHRKYGDRLSVCTHRDCWDYLYDAESMKTFAGKKLSTQRNHVNKFRRLYPDCRFVELTPDNLDRAREFCRMFVLERQNHLNVSEQEGQASIQMLDYIFDLGGVGGFLELDGGIIALSLGETVGDTLFVHVEKALHEYPGVYQVMVSEFAKRFAVDGVRFINREEDDGIEGLRYSKISYHPVRLLEKFNVFISELPKNGEETV